MARGLNRGEVWQYTFRKPDKRRPVVILSRQDVIGLLHTVTVAPVTSTIRGLPSEVVIGAGEGLKKDSAVNLDHVQTVEKSRLQRYLGSLSREKMNAICKAMAIALGCDDVS
ncbi:MAG TPA: type II toxin-antitoxin system PemK/MazF family toxin [Thermoanaerobaculia bacterium]|nr:type II toxin-antitoxin system PemK/MazF family toxin [Thermoanaerobaculia bacterium]